MASSLNGLILQSIGGFYYVEAADAVYECRARGIFRKNGLTPVAGDRVLITPREEGTASLDTILERKNYLIRPPVANLDHLCVVASMADPAPNPLIIDKMIAIAESKGIEPVVILTKSDLGETSPWEDIYRGAGLPVFSVTMDQPMSAWELKRFLSGKISAFTGNSGVGKSTLMNVIDPRLSCATGEISQKLGRGRHTTRSAVLYKLPGGGYAADTPGFSSLDLEKAERIRKGRLADCFREFAPYLGECRFTSCTHLNEPGCAVRAAVEQGMIARSRYDSYTVMYSEVKDWKEWEK